MEAPTPCVCGRIVELDEMKPVDHSLPDGGNLVCDRCFCVDCEGDGYCGSCDIGQCEYCGANCRICKGSGDCPSCNGLGYKIKGDDE